MRNFRSNGGGLGVLGKGPNPEYAKRLEGAGLMLHPTRIWRAVTKPACEAGMVRLLSQLQAFPGNREY